MAVVAYNIWMQILTIN